MTQSLHNALIDLLGSSSLSDIEIRHLLGWYALSLTDLLRRRCITVRYAEQTLFNMDVVKKLEHRPLEDCVELIDWGMQLEDWEEHTPDRLTDALTTIEELAQRLLVTNSPSAPSSVKPGRKRTQRQSQAEQR
ncbi:MAG: DUF3969 family protein [Deltaproteobacteria bacterium]|nr:DUF3969 family protein [Deltaproteobacteria bacterium]